MNKIILIGRLTADPEQRTTATRFTLAVDRQKEGTDFIPCVCFGKLAEAILANLGKGRLVAVEGRLQVNNYETKDGERRKDYSVVAERVQFLDWPKKDNLGGISGQEVDFGECPF